VTLFRVGEGERVVSVTRFREVAGDAPGDGEDVALDDEVYGESILPDFGDDGTEDAGDEAEPKEEE
jgi:hypothetical protein